MILVIDNYDSFTYNLVQYLGQCGAEVRVRRNDEVSLEEITEMRPDGIMLSPGPCTPSQSGVCLDVLREAMAPGGRLEGIPLFGVCLGHQAIGHAAGGRVEVASHIRHGKASQIRHDGRGLFEGMPNPFSAIRYHSLVVTRATVPEEFEISATAEDDGEVMGLRHRTLSIEGVQFHPESVLTEDGMTIVANFVKRCRV
ncbi:MAG TPA: aminodeoxychorismate/anthranilate synthase component II [Fimbriimonadaceae bacterium]|nr:aminodeoxychorismate/anthranilate synthase component II [Fimbriimonadaceae bacterium]